MKNNRRDFIKKSAITGLATLVTPSIMMSNNDSINNESITAITPALTKRPKVLFFDVNETLLDLTAMKESVGKALNGRTELLPLWFTTMLQYSLVSTVANQYEGFAVIGAAALRMVARNNGIELTEQEAKDAIITPIRSLPAHPEVRKALEALKADGYKLVSFTNSSNKGVETQFINSGLIDLFDERLSIEDIGKFKPHADAYQWAARKMNIAPEDCLLVAAHGWDVAGAQWAGWKAAFIARPGQQLYPLAPTPDINETDLLKVAKQLMAIK